MLRRFARCSFSPKQTHQRAGETILRWGLPILIGALATAGQAIAQPARTLRAGAKIVDITPRKFPVIVNAMFEERSAEKAVDPLTVRSLVLDDGATRIAIAVVDSCMLPRELIDRAKIAASEKCGIPPERMLVSATHTHSAPSAMGCLGSRPDPDYAAWLPEQIAAAIVQAASTLEPVRIGWTSVDDWEHTFNRRWIRRPDRVLDDPFGTRNVRAHMHPGHESADVVGPSGPVDPGLSLLALQTLDGRPRALLANYSQHYYGSPLLSADYFGAFTRVIAGKLGGGADFVAMMSQGTSGDLMWMDYSAPRNDPGYIAYAEAIARRAHAAYEQLQWHEWVPLRMAEEKMSLAFRLPDAKRLAAARETAARLNGRLPRSHAEIYALEALHLQARPSGELKLQAIRIGELGIVAIPNEVFALTGLKIKGASPLRPTFTIELANGAEGYIPPPEQHQLGGYTTWPARTAGLAAEAEPQIVDAVLSLLESVAEKPRRTLAPPNGVFARALLASKPAAYWRLEDPAGNVARDETALHRDGRYESGVALWLPGVDERVGFTPPRPSAPNAFSEDHFNRAVHFAGGRMKTEVPDLGAVYSAEFWFWNGLPADAREVTGYLVSRGPEGVASCPGDHLGVGGSLRPDLSGRLFFFNGNERNEILAGRTAVAWREWHHIALVRDGRKVTVWLNGNPDPEISGTCEVTRPNDESPVFFGGRSDNFANFEGKLDEIALYDRALAQEEVAAHYRASGLPAKPLAPKIGQANEPLSPADSLKKMRVRSGFRAELVAAEPLVLDPVAIDWDESGRLWVVEMSDYPLGMDNKGAPGGRIRLLEDLDANGVYDRATLFADGLHMPTGLLTWRGGVLVTTAPEIIFLKDTDRDGRADLREVLLSGFLVGNPQLRVNGLRWGLDAWVYCAAGGHHGNYGAGTRIHSTRARRDVAVGSRDLRFRPDNGDLQAASGPAQFGRNRDERGRWFGTQNSFPLWHYVLPDHYLGRNPHLAAPEPIVQVVTPKNPPIYPAVPPDKRYHSFEEAGHFTSACSGMIYGDDLLFPRNEIGHAFICEPFHNLVHHSEIRDDGVTFRGHRAEAERTTEFVSSEDRWFRPVMARTGPDGALWIVDMYRSMIEHPEWLPPEGRAELLPQYRRGDDRGRIYRVVPVSASPRTAPRLDQLSGHDLVVALESSNSWTRDKIQQLLFWRNERAVAPALEKLARESGNPLVRLQALCTLDSLDALSAEIVESAMADSEAAVRENGLRLAETVGHDRIIGAATKLVRDPSAKVRLQLAFTLGEWEDPDAGKALATLLLTEHEQPFIVAAALSSALPHRRAIFTAAAKVAGEPLKKLAPALFALALGSNDREGTRQLLTALLEGTGSVSQVEMFGDFLNALRRARSSLTRLASQEDALSQTLQSADRLFAFARAVATDPARPLPERVSVATVLSRHPSYVDEAIPLLAAWLTPAAPHDIQRVVIEALAATGRDHATLLFFRAFPSLAPNARNAVLDQLLSREDWTLQLLEQIKEGRLAASAIDAARRGRVTKHPAATIRTRALQIFAESGSTAPAQRIEQFRESLSLQGDARRGAALFEQRCATCHRRGAIGNDLGPDIRSVISHEPARLLTSIIDPSGDVQPGFYAYHCRLGSGEEIYGIISAETETALTFKLVDATTRTVLRKEIALLQNSNRSLMPDGLETGLTPQEMADLIVLLRSAIR